MEVMFKSREHLIEEFNYGFEYHHLNDEGTKAITPPINCKDFITDLWWSEYTGQNISIYNFRHTPGTVSTAKKRHFIALTLSEQDLSPAAQRLQTLLNEVELQWLGAPSSVVSVVNGTALRIEYDHRWTKAPVLVSLFTTLLRIGILYEGGSLLSFVKTLAADPKRKDVAHIKPDIKRVKPLEHALQHVLDAKPISQQHTDYQSVQGAHLAGIVGCTKW